MDIWQWVHDTQSELYAQNEHRLAELLFEVPHLVVNNNYQRLEALLPEALAGAKRIKSPWLELFFRHWKMQSRVLIRGDVKGNLDEAVSLLDFAHEPTTQECPQGICAVQDLAHCYALVDGPGYAQERIAVAEEALEKIDPSWNCFGCISGELVSALRDQGDLEAAWARFQQQEAAHPAPTTSSF